MGALSLFKSLCDKFWLLSSFLESKDNGHLFGNYAEGFFNFFPKKEGLFNFI